MWILPCAVFDRDDSTGKHGQVQKCSLALRSDTLNGATAEADYPDKIAAWLISQRAVAHCTLLSHHQSTGFRLGFILPSCGLVAPTEEAC